MGSHLAIRRVSNGARGRRLFVIAIAWRVARRTWSWDGDSRWTLGMKGRLFGCGLFGTAGHALDAVKIGVLECALGEQDERAAGTPIDAESQKPYR
jgi:hypothetical protein